MSHIAAVRGASVALALALITGLFAPAAGGAGAPRRSAVLDPEIYADHTSGRAIVGFDHDVGPGTIRRLSRAGISHAVVIEAIEWRRFQASLLGSQQPASPENGVGPFDL